MKTRTPPCNIELEQSVLGSIFLDNEALSSALEHITSADVFYRPVHRFIFEAMLALYEKNEPVDLMTVSEQLRKTGEFDEIGIEYLAELLDASPTAANIKVHARMVKEKYNLRRYITACSEGVQIAYEGEDDADAIGDEIEKMIFAVSHDRATKTLLPISGTVKKSFALVEQAFATKSLITGVPTGYKDLDAKTAGFQSSDLIIIAGRPSMGKTAFAINIAQNLCNLAVAENWKEPPVIALFSLEMSAEQLVLRMLCSEARVSSHRLRTGYLSQSDWPRITTAAGRIHEYDLHIDDSAAATALDIRSKSRRLMAEKGRLDMVIIDYLQLMSSRGKTESRVQEVSEITRQLKQLAKELHVPVVALSQLSRKVEERPDKRPLLSDLRESGSIEQDADVVLFVYREEFYKKEQTPSELMGTAEVIIGKQRNGPTGTVHLTFQGDYTRFENMVNPTQQEN